MPRKKNKNKSINTAASSAITTRSTKSDEFAELSSVTFTAMEKLIKPTITSHHSNNHTATTSTLISQADFRNLYEISQQIIRHAQILLQSSNTITATNNNNTPTDSYTLLVDNLLHISDLPCFPAAEFVLHRLLLINEGIASKCAQIVDRYKEAVLTKTRNETSSGSGGKGSVSRSNNVNWRKDCKQPHTTTSSTTTSTPASTLSPTAIFDLVSCTVNSFTCLITGQPLLAKFLFHQLFNTFTTAASNSSQTQTNTNTSTIYNGVPDIFQTMMQCLKLYLPSTSNIESHNGASTVNIPTPCLPLQSNIFFCFYWFLSVTQFQSYMQQENLLHTLYHYLSHYGTISSTSISTTSSNHSTKKVSEYVENLRLYSLLCVQTLSQITPFKNQMTKEDSANTNSSAILTSENWLILLSDVLVSNYSFNLRVLILDILRHLLTPLTPNLTNHTIRHVHSTLLAVQKQIQTQTTNIHTSRSSSHSNTNSDSNINSSSWQRNDSGSPLVRSQVLTEPQAEEDDDEEENDDEQKQVGCTTSNIKTQSLLSKLETLLLLVSKQ